MKLKDLDPNLLNDIKQYVNTIFEGDSDDVKQAGIVLLASAYVGSFVRTLAKFCGVSEWYVRRLAVPLRRDGIWGTPNTGKVFANWFPEEGGLDPVTDEIMEECVMSFILDVLVATGTLKRVRG